MDAIGPGHKEQWRKPFEDAAAMGIKVAIVTTDARMLAYSNLKHLICGESAMMGTGWHEFIDPDDMPRVKEWMATFDDSPISYRQMCQERGKPKLKRITLLKLWAGEAWLCVGAVRPLWLRGHRLILQSRRKDWEEV